MDDFIGTRFGEFSQLEVIGISGKRNNNKIYSVICHTCKNDPELFGEAIYYKEKYDLMKGSIPCGCSNGVKWTEQQYDVIMRRKCKSLNYNFLRFSGDWKGKWTKFYAICDKGHEVEMSMNNFLFGYKCKRCGIISSQEKQTHSYEQEISEFYNTGRIAEGTIFTKSNRKTTQSHSSYWDYKCGICSKDEYVKNGVCSGIFTTVASSLKKGQVSCRCSKSYYWNQPQRELQIRLKIKERNSNLQFLRWESSDYGIHSTIYLECPTHGEFSTTLTNFIHNETGCPMCAGGGGFDRSKTGYFYVLKVQSSENSFTGYGITGNLENRLRTHEKSFSDNGYSIVDNYFFVGKGDTVLALEGSVKRAFPRNSQDIDGFKTEATLCENFKDVVDYSKNFTYNGDTITSYIRERLVK